MDLVAPIVKAHVKWILWESKYKLKLLTILLRYLHLSQKSRVHTTQDTQKLHFKLETRPFFLQNGQVGHLDSCLSNIGSFLFYSKFSDSFDFSIVSHIIKLELYGVSYWQTKTSSHQCSHDSWAGKIYRSLVSAMS